MDDPGRSPRRGRMFILAAAVLWSLAGVVAKRLDLDAGSIAVYRSLFAGLALLAIVPPRRRVVRPAMVPLGAGLRGDDRALPGGREDDDGSQRDHPPVHRAVLDRPARPRSSSRSDPTAGVLGIALATLGVLAIVGSGTSAPARAGAWHWAWGAASDTPWWSSASRRSATSTRSG